MSKRIGNYIIIEEEQDGTCEYCGAIAELRPYGIDGKKICFDCGMKNKKETNKNMELMIKKSNMN